MFLSLVRTYVRTVPKNKSVRTKEEKKNSAEIRMFEAIDLGPRFQISHFPRWRILFLKNDNENFFISYT